MQKIPPLQFIVYKIPLTVFPMENRLVASGRGNVIALSRCYALKLSAGVAPCNMVGLVKLFELLLRDKFHQK